MRGGGRREGLRRRGLPLPDPERAADWEVEHHLEELADRLVAQGLAREEARTEAERRFGDPGRYRAAIAHHQRRRRTTMRRTEAWGLLAGGVRQAARTVRRSPGLTAGVVLTLALGVGANAAMFGVLDRLLFQPPAHVVDHESVRRVVVERPYLGRTVRTSSMAYLDYLDFEGNSAFASVAAWWGVSTYTLGSGADATRIRATAATWDLFPLLGVAAHRGRLFGADDDRVGAQPTAVLSHEYWHSALGSDPNALGRTLEISGTSFTVVGIAPPGFTGVDLEPVDVWLPLLTASALLNGTEWIDSRGWYWLSTVVRLAPGADVGAAAEQATAAHVNGRRESIERERYSAGARVALDPLIAARGPEASGESQVARWLGGVSLVLLLIACANVANLLLARGTRRRREVAVRLALGVSRVRLVTVMVLESVLLALLGGGVALVLAWWGGGLIRGVLLPGVLFPGAGMGDRVAAFTLGAATVAGLLAGIGPALQATRADLAGDLAMGAGAASGRRSRTRSLLTLAQAALSVVLLVGAGLFVRSVAAVRSLDLGFDVDRLVMATLEFQTGGPGSAGDGAGGEQNGVYAAAMGRLATVPGVVSVAGTSSPFQWAFATELNVPGLDSLPSLPGGGPYFQDVTPDYLGTVGLAVTRGRGLRPSDAEGMPLVAVISETMARTLWPDDDPLGRCLLVGEGAAQCTTVVGVVQDASRGSIQEEPYMAYYMPLAQREGRRIATLYVRASGDPAEIAGSIAPVLRSLDPRVRYAVVQPLRDRIDPQARSWTLGATLFTVFGLLALLVAAIGLYGVLAFDVAQRTREIGIRTALGAERRRLLGAVVLDGMRIAGLGVALGLVTAAAAAPYARDLLFQVSPRDPVVLAVVAAVLLGAALVASVAPGFRATRVDPMVALRSE